MSHAPTRIAERRIDWDRVEQLFDELMGLSSSARAVRLDELRSTESEMASELATLIACAPLADGFFQKLPRVAASVAADAVRSHSEPSADRTRALLADDHPGSVIAQYQIGEQIGRGGMGIVYEGSDTRLNRPVALKFLPPHLWVDRRARERLMVEARAAAALDHPNICAVHEVGETSDGALFLAMALYDGETLRERLTRGPMAIDAAVDVAIQVARALAAAHAQGIVHRDVKPANLMLTSSGVVKLLDFGLARLPDVTVTPTGLTPGTIAYMAPEQVRGEPADARCDLWALGVVLFELLTGRRPFGGDSEAAVLHAILTRNVDVRQVPTGQSAVPDALARVVDRLLRREPADRYQSASALLADLSALGNNDAVSRRRTPHWLRVPQTRRVQRRFAAFALLGMVASALAVVRWRQDTQENRANPKAFELYVAGTQARYQSFGSDDRDASKAFEAAIAKDSTFAPAYAGLAFVHVFSGDAARARALAERALSLDSKLAEAHMVLGMVRSNYDRDWAGAEQSYKHAIRLNRGYAEAHHELSMHLMRQKRFDEALEAAQRALYLSPMSARFEHGLGEIYLFSDRAADALAAAERALKIDSTAAGSHFLQAAALTELKRFDDAAAVLERCIPVGCGDEGRSLLGYVYGVTGNREAARRIADTFVAQWTTGNAEPPIPYLTAQVFAGLGEKSLALDWLERDAGNSVNMLYLAIEPTLRSLHGERRFDALLRKLWLKK